MNEQQPPVPPSVQPVSKPGMTGREEYNLISDTVTGPNVRFKDNLYQGLAILLCLVLGAGVGCMAAPEQRLAGAGIGALIGLIAGLLLSGAFLMVYRAVKHARGRHD